LTLAYCRPAFFEEDLSVDMILFDILPFFAPLEVFQFLPVSKHINEAAQGHRKQNFWSTISRWKYLIDKNNIPENTDFYLLFKQNIQSLKVAPFPCAHTWSRFPYYLSYFFFIDSWDYTFTIFIFANEEDLNTPSHEIGFRLNPHNHEETIAIPGINMSELFYMEGKRIRADLVGTYAPLDSVASQRIWSTSCEIGYYPGCDYAEDLWWVWKIYDGTDNDIGARLRLDFFNGETPADHATEFDFFYNDPGAGCDPCSREVMQAFAGRRQTTSGYTFDILATKHCECRSHKINNRRPSEVLGNAPFLSYYSLE